MQAENLQSPKSNSSVASLLGKWLTFGIAGIILATLGYYISERDIFIQWHVFAPSTLDAAQVMEGDPYEVKILTSSGAILRRGYDDEIWTSGVLSEEINKQDCDQYPAAFSFINRAPDDMLDCAAFDGADVEYGYTVLYAIDQQGVVWQWKSIRHGMTFLVYPIIAIFGGVLGVLIGSVVWTKRPLSVKRSMSQVTSVPGEAASIQDGAPTEINEVSAPQDVVSARQDGARKKTGVWILAALPFLCLLVWLMWRCIPVDRSRQNQQATTKSRSDTFINAYGTKEAAWYQIPPITPNPAGPAYDFVVLCSSAQWYGFQSTYYCSTRHRAGVVSIETTTYQEPGKYESKPTVQIFMPIGTRIEAKYPVWEIQPGDRFQATLACHVDIIDCNLRYYLFFEEYRSKTIPLGEWQLTDDQRTVDIDVNLSHFSGKLVTFMLWTMNYGSDQAEQIALWINPRIETVK